MDERDPDPYMLYTVVRRSLSLSAGKVGAQCQHAFDYLTREIDRLGLHPLNLTKEDDRHLANIRAWRYDRDHAKVVLGANDEEFDQVKAENPQHFLVIDNGYTQVEPNTETCLALWPMRKSERSPILRKLRPL